MLVCIKTGSLHNTVVVSMTELPCLATNRNKNSNFLISSLVQMCWVQRLFSIKVVLIASSVGYINNRGINRPLFCSS